MAMLRTEAVAAMAAARGTMLSIITMQPTAPWVALGQADHRNINLLGSMGSAAALGLGLAMSQPDERILVLDGDGSLLMQLGSLVTVAGQRPRNFFHVVFENGRYETSGGQDVPGREVTDLCGMARAAGYLQVVRYESIEEMADLPRVLSGDGPAFISLVISGQGEVPPSEHDKPPHFSVQMENMRVLLAAGDRK